MTDPDFDDPAYDHLRALLADAAAPREVPAEVASRLDATLAELVAARASEPAGEPAPEPAAVRSISGTPLTLRRRPLGQRLLVAAAAVAVLGAGAVGLDQVIGGGGQDGQSDMSVASTAEDAASAPLDAPGAGGGSAGGGTTGGGTAGRDDELDGLGDQTLARNRVLFGFTSFTADGFAGQVEDLVRTPPTSEYSAPDVPNAPSAPEPQLDGGAPSAPAPVAGSAGGNGGTGATAGKAPCTGPEVAAGSQVLPITFEGRRAALVLHPVIDGSRYVAAWSCDGRRLLASTTVAG